MIGYLKNKYSEWKYNKTVQSKGEEYRDYKIGVRDHPTAHDEYFDRYAAIVYIVKELIFQGIIERDTPIIVSNDGKSIEFIARCKHLQAVSTISEKVR